MNEMVDKIATALFEHQIKEYPESATAKRGFYADGIYHAAARIALTAMQEPTPEMVTVAEKCRFDVTVISNYKKIIGAALGDV